MSAVVCGKRSLFEEIHPPVQKRLRCGGGTSPVRFSSLRSGSPLGYCEVGPSSSADPVDQVSQLRNLFPEMDGELIEKVLEASGNNLDSAIRSLNELRLSSDVGDETVNLSVQKNEALGHEANLDDAKDRATRALEAFENAVIARSGCVFQELQKENAVLKEQIHNLIKENHILKRAVAIQHERNAEHENCPQEMQRLKQLVAQYQEQVRTLEVNNYALTLHLRKAQEGSSIPGRFHPDVF
ncbi:hypothetical protein KP509_33G056200 [Ceratopteris richardii]|uniref:CUE domain-containing protein n=1 Tax=Ceratopteris richardii TaxID=49495 RepID=A0A8T2QPZ0_CERRI|nr:hypothetical protein KP509_33G056200 [Ceratopteris richardii]